MRVIQEPDRLDRRAVWVIGLVTLFMLVASAVLTFGVRAFARRGLQRSETQIDSRPPLAEPLLGGQQAWQFERHAPRAYTREAPPELEQYGWVDRQRGLVRIPISRAKELYLERTARARVETGAPERTFVVGGDEEGKE